MRQFVYAMKGDAVGFTMERYVYKLDGTPVGQLNGGTHVHKLSGDYVGELHDSMVLDMHLGSFGNIGNPGDPGNPGDGGNPGSRGSRSLGYADVFQRLLSK